MTTLRGTDLSGSFEPNEIGPSGVSLGECPVCLSPVLYADPVFSGGSFVLLDPILPARLVPFRGRTAVVVSSVGRPQVVEPWVYRLHSCPPGSITEAKGFYTVDVLSQSCPVVLCHANPGEFCISTRHEVLLRPHGARVMVASGIPLTDELEV